MRLAFVLNAALSHCLLNQKFERSDGLLGESLTVFPYTKLPKEASSMQRDYVTLFKWRGRKTLRCRIALRNVNGHMCAIRSYCPILVTVHV